METFLRSMTWPFLACLVLTGMHVYLGIHVLARKVIFVDLALATIAALGAVWAALLGWDLHEDVWVVKGFSLGFTFLGAAVFSLSRMRHERVPQEAIIGIAYAVALGAIILGTAKLPHGAEEVRDLQAGSILWVRPSTVLSTAALYAAIGVFHFVFRKKFLALSFEHERAEAEGLRVRLWDFLFYVSFGFVVTSSVSIAGVLLVFSYLVIPSAVAVLFADGIAARLAIGWTVGTLVSASGVAISYQADLPSGPVIVVAFGVLLVLAGIVHALRNAVDPGRTALRVGGSLAAFALVLVGSTFLSKRAETDFAHLLETGTKSEKLMVLARVAEAPDRWAEIETLAPHLLATGEIEIRLNLLDLVAALKRTSLLPEIHTLLGDGDDIVREHALGALRSLADPSSIEPLLAAAAREEDEYLKVELAELAVELGDGRGVPFFLDVMERGDALQSRRDAFEHLSAHLPSELPFHADGDSGARAAEVAAWRAWWSANAHRIQIK